MCGAEHRVCASHRDDTGVTDPPEWSASGAGKDATTDKTRSHMPVVAQASIQGHARLEPHWPS